MPELHAYLLFIGAGLLLNITLGADMLINVLNPGIALFFLAFLPQFIDPAAGDRTLAFAVLGLTFNITGTAVNCLAALATIEIGRLPAVRVIGRAAERLVGVLFVGLGVRLAVGQTD